MYRRADLDRWLEARTFRSTTAESQALKARGTEDLP